MAEIWNSVIRRTGFNEKKLSLIHISHLEVIHKVMDYASQIGFDILNLEFSPIKGPEGNIEYLLHLQKCPEMPGAIHGVTPEAVVDAAFETLKDVYKRQGKGVKRTGES